MGLLDKKAQENIAAAALLQRTHPKFHGDAISAQMEQFGLIPVELETQFGHSVFHEDLTCEDATARFDTKRHGIISNLGAATFALDGVGQVHFPLLLFVKPANPILPFSKPGYGGRLVRQTNAPNMVLGAVLGNSGKDRATIIVPIWSILAARPVLG